MSITTTAAWQKLAQHRQRMQSVHLRDLFSTDPKRFQRFSVRLEDLLFDYSKNRVTEETMSRLLELAEAADVPEAIAAMFRGEKLNITENRSALHVALRNRSNLPLIVDGVDVMPQVNAVLDQMWRFTEAIRSGQWRGYTGQPITDVVNIGIGGSDQGPRLLVRALRPYADDRLKVHFVSNIDPTNLAETLDRLDPASTLFLVASKSFTTQETMRNAHAARHWLLSHARHDEAVARHFVALSTNIAAVRDFGIAEENMFVLWDWVGGRFSVWSAIGLSAALYIGMEQFDALLEGAHAADIHFRTTPLPQNIPVILALLGIWYINFWGASTHAILPYDHRLAPLVDYIQQLDTESNGKHVTRDGQPVAHPTAPIIWGRPGTDAQHTFFQLLHQGTHLVPADFLVAAQSPRPWGDQHDVLLAHCLAQTKALMEGRTTEQARALLVEQGAAPAELGRLAAAKTFPGNQPTNTFLYKRLTPRTLGMLLALYEHKIFVQGTIWGINSFDQMGVELGKELANTLLPVVKSGGVLPDADSSTNGLLEAIHRWR